MKQAQLKAAILGGSPNDAKAIFDEDLPNGNLQQITSCRAPALDSKPTVFH
jgi:hypothetical protein